MPDRPWWGEVRSKPIAGNPDETVARVYFKLKRESVEPHFAFPEQDAGDPDLQSELVNAITHVLTQIIAEKLHAVVGLGYRHLTVIGRVRGKGWIKSLQKSAAQLLSDTFTLQSSVSSQALVGGRFDRKKATVICSFASENGPRDQIVDELSELDYSLGFRSLWREVVQERPQEKKVGTSAEREAYRFKLLEQFFETISNVPEELLDELTRLQTPVREAAIKKLQPAVRKLVQENPPQLVAEKRTLAKQVNNILSQLGLAIRHPKTGQACSIAAVGGSKAGYFVLQSKRISNHENSIKPREKSQSQLYLNDAIGPLELMEAPRQEHFADRSTLGRKS